MKTAKLVIGIISIVLFIVVAFQSCAAGIVEAIEGEGASGGAGIVLAFCMLIGGIIGLATRNGGKGGGIIAGVFYALGGIIGFANLGTFGDLIVWSVLNVIFAAVFILGSVLVRNQ